MFENLFSEELASLGIRRDFKKIAAAIFCISIIAAISAHTLIKGQTAVKSVIVISALILPAILAYLFLDYLKDSKQKKIESELPEALFQIASFPKNTPMEKIISGLSEKKSALGGEFRRSHNLIEAGFPTDESLAKISESNKSAILSRAISLISEAYENGAGLGHSLGEIAQDIFELQSLQKEAAASFSMQKYTILAGAALLLPLISGMLLSITGSLPNNDGEFGFSPKNPEIAQAISESVQIYIFLLAAISSAFVGLQEGKVKKAPLYFSIIFPVGLLIFNIARTISFV